MSHFSFTFAALLARRLSGGACQYGLRRALSLTPEFKSRFYFPLQRLDQILDGTYPKNVSWMSKWRAYLDQFHKLRLDQIKDMLYVCAKRRVVPLDLWQKLQTVHWTGKLFEAKGAELASVLHSLALLNQSRQLQKRRIQSEPFTRAVLKQALQRRDLHTFQPLALSQCIYSFALLELNGHPIVAYYSEEIIKSPHREQLNPHALANILWSWAKLKYSDTSVVAVLSSDVLRLKQSAGVSEMASILWAWSVLGHTPQPHWNAILEEICLRKTQLSGQQLSVIFAACVRGNYRFPLKILPLLQRTVDSRKHVFFTTRILSSLVWSLGKLQSPREHPSVIAILKEALKESRLQKATSQEICCLATGLSHLDYRDAADGMRLHREITQPTRLSSFNPQELCNLIWATGRMHSYGMDCQKRLAAEMVRRREDFDQFSCQGLVSVMVGWAHGGFSEKAESNVVLREVMKRDRLKQYNPQELANLVWSCGRLGIHSFNLYAKLMHYLSQDHILAALKPQGVMSILVGWAHGRFCDPSAIDVILQQLSREVLSQLKAQEVANVCWALGKVKYRGPIVKDLAQEASQRHRLQRFTALQLSTVLLGWSKSEMRDLELWDRLLAEFASREDTAVVDLPIRHNLTLAVQSLGFQSLSRYRSARLQPTELM